MRARIVASMSIVLAAPAGAQWNTNCSTIGSYTNCRTNGSPQSQQSTPWDILNSSRVDTSALLRAQQARQQMQATQQAEVAREQDAARLVETQNTRQDDDARRMAMRKHAGRLINEGNCDQALSYMLENGELGMASEVKLLCAR